MYIICVIFSNITFPEIGLLRKITVKTLFFLPKHNLNSSNDYKKYDNRKSYILLNYILLTGFIFLLFVEKPRIGYKRALRILVDLYASTSYLN